MRTSKALQSRVVSAVSAGDESLFLEHLRLVSGDPIFLVQLVHKAARCGNTGFLHILSQYVPDRILWGDTALHGASMSGDLSTVRWVLNIEERAPSNKLLNAAAQSGSVEMMKFWIDAGVRLEEDQGEALLSAAWANHIEAVEFILGNNARRVFEIKRSRVGNEAVAAAVSMRNCEMLELLLDQGADDGCTVSLSLAATHGSLKLTDYVLGRGDCSDTAITDAMLRLSESAPEPYLGRIAKRLIKKGYRIDEEQSIPLLNALQRKNWEVAAVLVESGGSIVSLLKSQAGISLLAPEIKTLREASGSRWDELWALDERRILSLSSGGCKSGNSTPGSSAPRL